MFINTKAALFLSPDELSFKNSTRKFFHPETIRELFLTPTKNKFHPWQNLIPSLRGKE